MTAIFGPVAAIRRKLKGIYMDIKVRSAKVDHAAELGMIRYQALGTWVEHHRFAPDFSTGEIATRVMSTLISGFYGTVGEVDARLGAIFSISEMKALDSAIAKFWVAEVSFVAQTGDGTIKKCRNKAAKVLPIQDC
jgi:hypothetical protein